MRKVVEIPYEVMERLLEGKYVEGSLHRNKVTGAIVYNAYNRKSKTSEDRVVEPLEHGWMKESATRYKFYNSVKKELGLREIYLIMTRELKKAMQALELENILNNV